MDRAWIEGEAGTGKASHVRPLRTVFDESMGASQCAPFPALRKTSSFSQQNKAKAVLYPLILPTPGITSTHSLDTPFKVLIFLESEWNSLLFSGCEMAQMLICILKKSQAACTGHPADTRSPCSRQSITRVCSSKFKLFLQVELLITALECFMTVPIQCLCSATRRWNSTG